MEIPCRILFCLRNNFCVERHVVWWVCLPWRLFIEPQYYMLNFLLPICHCFLYTTFLCDNRTRIAIKLYGANTSRCCCCAKIISQLSANVQFWRFWPSIENSFSLYLSLPFSFHLCNWTWKLSILSGRFSIGCHIILSLRSFSFDFCVLFFFLDLSNFINACSGFDMWMSLLAFNERSRNNVHMWVYWVLLSGISFHILLGLKGWEPSTGEWNEQRTERNE